MQCPYCGGEMISGRLNGAGRPIRFIPEGKKLTFSDMLSGTGRINAQKNVFGEGRTIPAEYCPHCEKIIFDTKLAK